jgi:hypothetical protein
VNGLRVIVTLFTGHMSGVNWLPPWLLDGERESDPRFRLIAGGRVVKSRIRDLYEDPFALAAQVRMLEAAAEAGGGSSGAARMGSGERTGPGPAASNP